MANPLSGTNEKPSIAHLQYLQDNWTSEEIAATKRVAKVTVASGGFSTPVEADIPMGAEIIGASVICTRTNGGGTMQVRTASAAPANITDALTCAVADAMDYAATIDTDNNVVGADGVEVLAAADGDGGIVYIEYIK